MSVARRATATGGVDRASPNSAAAVGVDAELGWDSEDVQETEDRPLLTPSRRPSLYRELTYDAFTAPQPDSSASTKKSALPSSKPAYAVSSAKRAAQVGFAVLACWLASGIVCGFAALKPVLIAEGVYRDLCPPDTPSPSESSVPCPEQDMRLNLFFVCASVALNVSTVLAGWVLDRRGRRACYLAAAGVLALGSGLLSFAFAYPRAPLTQWFDAYLLGNVLLGLGGTFLFVASYQLANAFPASSGLVVALVTGAFDASAAVFLFYKMAYDATGGSFTPARFFLAFLVVVPVLLLVPGEFLLMPPRAYDSRAQRAARQDDDDTTTLTLDKLEADSAQQRAARSDSVWGALHGLPVSAQLRTPWFLLAAALTVLQMMRMNYFIATVRAQYRFMLGGDDALAERVNNLFDAALPVAGVASTPLIGLFLSSGVGTPYVLAVLSALIVVLGVLNCLPYFWAGYATVVVFVLFRPLYYSTISDYCTKVFGFATFGRVYGAITAVSGAFQLAQPGLDALVHGPLLRGNPVPVNAAFAVAGAVNACALTVYVYAQTRRREKCREGDGQQGAEEEEEQATQRGGGGGGYGAVGASNGGL